MKKEPDKALELEQNIKQGAEYDALMDYTRKNDKQSLPPDKNLLRKDQMFRIIQNIAKTHGITTLAATQAVSALFLKGAASLSAPNSLSVDVYEDGKGGVSTTITKASLMYYYELETNNKHLRRLAETMRNEISIFAEKMELPGDLAQQLSNKQLAKKLPSLTAKQKSWCSSFNQGNPKLEADAELRLVAEILAEDLQEKFKKKDKSQNSKNPNSNPIQKSKKSSPRAQGKSKPSAKGKIAKKATETSQDSNQKTETKGGSENQYKNKLLF